MEVKEAKEETETQKMFKKLSTPFEAHEIEWRAAQSGFKKDGKPWVKVLAYIDARAVMDRLDKVVGPENWSDNYRKEGNATICRLSIKVPAVGTGYSSWVSKEDGSEDSDIEAVKGGLSGAMKRAAVKWGISRYLYNLSENFARVSEEFIEGGVKFDIKDQSGQRKYFYFEPPRLPEWALPSKSEQMEEKTKANLADAAMIAVQSSNVTPLADPKDIKIDVVLLKSDILQCQTLDHLKTLWMFMLPGIMKLDKPIQAELNAMKDKKKEELSIFNS